MLDPTSAYRTTQVVGASKAGQIVLLYQGAIRFSVQHLAWIERGNVEQAHKSSVRAQEIVAALRESLDLSAGPIAAQLDLLYEFVLRRLMEGNLAKKPKPTEEAVQVLRGLLEAWEALAAQPAQTDAASEPARVPVPMAIGTASLVGAGAYRGGR
jgi:flagellar secretion chaperone FliS